MVKKTYTAVQVQTATSYKVYNLALDMAFEIVC